METKISEEQAQAESLHALDVVLILWTKYVWLKFAGMTEDPWKTWFSKQTRIHISDEQNRDS